MNLIVYFIVSTVFTIIYLLTKGKDVCICDNKICPLRILTRSFWAIPIIVFALTNPDVLGLLPLIFVFVNVPIKKWLKLLIKNLLSFAGENDE